MITLNKIDREETVRYLGNSGVEMNSTMEGILDICEEKILSTAKPKYLYKTIALENSGLLVGNSISKHLENCQNAVILCATLGAEIDKLIRTAQVTDMAQAVVIDSMSSVAVEQICNSVEELIIAENPALFTTWRFSPGYGDYPIELQSAFLKLLDAPRKIGLCTNHNSILTPTKSVTAIIGLSETPIEQKRRGCQSCNLAKTCKFRKAGNHCGF